MNPYLAIGALLALIGVFGTGVATGKKWEEGRNAIEQNHIAEAVDAANAASAKAIAQIKPKYTTIQNKLEKQIESNTVYRDCHADAVGMQLLNSALTGAKHSGSGELPKADAARK